MTVTVANTSNNNSYWYAFDRLNELAYAMSTKAVTTNSNTATGNAAISGTFTAAGLIANSISILAANLTINNTTVSVGTILATSANLTSITANTATIATGTITALTSNSGNVTNFFSSTANITTGSVTNLTSNAATIASANIATLLATTANCVTLTGNTLTFPTANIAALTINTLAWGTGSFAAPNTVQIANNQYYFNANGSWVYLPISVPGSNTQIIFNDSGSTSGYAGLTFNKTSNTLSVANSIVLGNNVTQFGHTTTTGATLQTVDTFSLSSYRGAEYVVTLKDNTANNYQITKILLVHDDGNAVLTEYGGVCTNSTVGVFTSSANSTVVSLQVTPTSTNTSVHFQKTLISLFN